MADSVRVLYVIGDLGRGGAQKQLHLLLKHMDRSAFAPVVVALAEGGHWAGPIRALDVPVIELPRRRSLEAGRLVALYRAVRRVAPTILQTMLFSDHVYGLLTGCLARTPILITSRRVDQYTEATSTVRRLSQVLWRRADATVCNAERSRQAAPAALAARHVVIPNGIEPVTPTRGRAEVRRDLGVPEGALLVGGVGRLVPGKNQSLFIDVASEILRGRHDVRFVLAEADRWRPNSARGFTGWPWRGRSC